MSYREPSGKRAYLRMHPDQILYDPLPGQATKDAWSDITFDWHIQKLTEAKKRQRAFAAQDSQNNA